MTSRKGIRIPENQPGQAEPPDNLIYRYPAH